MAENTLIQPLRISVVEDDDETRAGLVGLLRMEPGIEVVGAHASGEEATRCVPAENPDVVLMDIQLGGMSGIEAVRQLARVKPGVNIVMLTMFEDGERIVDALRAGARGYLLKNKPVRELVEGIRLVHAGGSPMSLGVARKVVEHFQAAKPPPPELAQLSEREYQVLEALASGRRVKHIGKDLGLAEATVRCYVRRIYDKLQVGSRGEAVVQFLERKG